MPSGNPLIGTMFHAGRAKMRRKVRGKTREDFDGIECFRFLLPLVPVRPVHVWNWGIDNVEVSWLRQKQIATYSWRSMPIRWSWYLLARAILQAWLWIALILGMLICLITLAQQNNDCHHAVWLEPQVLAK